MVIRLLAVLTHRRKRSAKQPLVLAIGVVVVLTYVLLVHPINVTMPMSYTVSTGSGKGAGGRATNPVEPATPSLCNPFDTNCFANGIASFLASQLQSVFQPLADLITQNPANIITQTAPEDSYGNAYIENMNALFVAVFDLALACMIVVGAYNVLIGHHWRMLHTSFSEFIPRVVVVAGAVHFNLFFVQQLIDLENDLALAVIHAASQGMLTNLIAGFLTAAPSGLLAWILMLVLAVMLVYLLIQMVGRLALVALGIATAPLGLGCLMLPQTQRWGRLWLTTFSSAVIIQLLQVIALALGGIFLYLDGTHRPATGGDLSGSWDARPGAQNTRDATTLGSASHDEWGEVGARHQ